MTLVERLDARGGRWYFGAQSAAGAAWWLGVAGLPGIRTATLGSLPAPWVAAFDIPLFVIASALAAGGVRWSAEITTAWTLLVAAGMAGYATVTGQAGWGALLMMAAGAASTAATVLVRLNRLPSEWLLTGLFAAREASSAPVRVHALRTAGQIVVFWGVCLVIIPLVITALEARWGLRIPMPAVVPIVGVALLVAASALGLWSAGVMAGRGDGTPLPVATARRLVIAGPYRYVRNPMAVAGIAQGAAVGMLCGSWLVIGYALCGSLVWNHLIRPGEEADLQARFGRAYDEYRSQVSCWIPRFPGIRSAALAKAASYTDRDV